MELQCIFYDNRIQCATPGSTGVCMRALTTLVQLAQNCCVASVTAQTTAESTQNYVAISSKYRTIHSTQTKRFIITFYCSLQYHLLLLLICSLLKSSKLLTKTDFPCQTGSCALSNTNIGMYYVCCGGSYLGMELCCGREAGACPFGGVGSTLPISDVV